MKLKSSLTIFVILLFSLTLLVACGGDDDDPAIDGDNTDGDAIDGDTADGDEDSNNAIDGLMAQASQGCTQYWDEQCEYDFSASEIETTEAFCEAWLNAYAPTMEQFADGMDMDCMMTVMGGFFTCMGESCDPDTTWNNCNGQVQAQMMSCFTQ